MWDHEKVTRGGQEGYGNSGNKVAAEGGPAGAGYILLDHLHEGPEGRSRVADWQEAVPHYSLRLESLTRERGVFVFAFSH